MFSISFIFKPGTYDDEFRRLDAATQAVAESTEPPGLRPEVAPRRRSLMVDAEDTEPGYDLSLYVNATLNLPRGITQAPANTNASRS